MCTVVNKQFEKINRWTIFFIKVTLPFIRGEKIIRSNLLNNNNMVSKSVTSNIFVQLEGHPITNSQLWTLSTCFHRRLCCFFYLWRILASITPARKSPICRKVEATRLLGDWPGPPERYIFFSVLPLCGLTGFPYITEVDIKAHRAAPASRGPTHMHLLHRMSLFAITTGNEP